MKYKAVGEWAKENYEKYATKGFRIFRETADRVLFVNSEASKTAFEPGDDSFLFGFWIDKSELELIEETT